MMFRPAFRHCFIVFGLTILSERSRKVANSFGIKFANQALKKLEPVRDEVPAVRVFDDFRERAERAPRDLARLTADRTVPGHAVDGGVAARMSVGVTMLEQKQWRRSDDAELFAYFA